MDWKDETEKVYYKIGEAADILKVESYVIRYWETEFKFIKPLKLNSSHRLYSKKEIEKLLIIKDLLYNKKFTVKGARNALKSGSYKLICTNSSDNSEVLQSYNNYSNDSNTRINKAIEELKMIKNVLSRKK
ncbi:MAG: MerR family transcriptional regulator [Deltaproteobacteria bacterium]|nr:MerR family transcriptional regulator [Deltaproteobacteria bacterium]